MPVILGLNYHITVDVSEFEAAASQASDEVFKAYASQTKAIYKVARARKQDAEENKEAKKRFSHMLPFGKSALA